MSYKRFAAMIATSTVVMFGLMPPNTYALDHGFYSQIRAWMAVVLGAVMSIMMPLASCDDVSRQTRCASSAQPKILSELL